MLHKRYTGKTTDRTCVLQFLIDFHASQAVASVLFGKNAAVQLAGTLSQGSPDACQK